jgi:1-acyl-sn-glycerol-3-phosphate acyltransferase
LFYRLKINGIENIPKEGAAIICPNHFSYADPLFVGISLSRNIKFMAKYELFKKPFLSFLLPLWGVYPVKRGEADFNAIRTTLKHLKDGQLIGVFPEGTRIRGNELGKANPGVAMFAVKSSCPIIPTAITGSYKPFSKLCITYGRPMDLSQYRKEKMTNDDYLELSQTIMEKIKELKRG